MSDVLSKRQRSFCMSRIRDKNTKPELALRKALWNAGLRYRLKSDLLGRPDLYFPGRRLVIFVDGCFWHGCPEHCQMPVENRAFWEEKLLKTEPEIKKLI
ncbi:very short patch repair endonuclease [Methylomonas fluvii]|uniref:very short patch repair endonuclease n=1 Tax=Methylomonas fluvii TaxID=1854564 RepID=UPI001CAA8683|nr:very short patch repair endonuclease [Methylomonas fluvii]